MPLTSKPARCRARAAVLVPVLLLAACDPGEESTDHSQVSEGTLLPNVRDSAGVRIVEFESLDGFPSADWHVALGESVRIGTLGDDDADAPGSFGMAIGVDRRDDGTVLVADAMAHEIRVFDREGRYLRSIGGRGQGPGEFEAVLGVSALRGDSITVTQSAGWTTFDADGSYAFSRRLEPEGIAFPAVSGIFSDGSLLIAHRRRSQTLEHEWGSESSGFVTYSRVDRAGVVTPTFGQFPFPSRLTLRGVVDPGNSQQPFVMLSPLPGGSARAMGERFYWSAPGLGEIQVFRADGQHEMTVRFHPSAAPRGVDLPIARGLSLPVAVEDRIRSLRDTLEPPVFSALLVDELGNLWLRELEDGIDTPPTMVGWYVLDPEGIPAARVSLPHAWGRTSSNARNRIGADYILAHESDDLGVDTFVLVPLRRD